MRSLRSISIFLLVAPMIEACASASSRPTEERTSSPDYVTSIEVKSTSAANAYELISRLRPRWLESKNAGSLSGGVRKQVIAVYLDGVRLGDADALRSISSTGIMTMQYYDAARAATLLRDTGSDPIAGAIVITSIKVQ